MPFIDENLNGFARAEDLRGTFDDPHTQLAAAIMELPARWHCLNV